jgi:NADH:ubiquinone oxidoreductase subunit 6 (subunit J)
VFEGLVFFVAAVLAVGGAVGIVTLSNPFFSVLALVGHLIALAVLFLLLDSAFVAAAQVVVYAGAVMVLYVFVVAYIGGGAPSMSPERSAFGAFGVLVALALLAELCVAVLGSGIAALGGEGAPVDPGLFGSPQQIGELLLSRFLIPFEMASFLLLVAAVAAVVLARRRRGLEEAGPSPDRGTPDELPPGGGFGGTERPVTEVGAA